MAHEDHAERAIPVATQIVSTVDDLNTDGSVTGGGVRLEVRVEIETGEVVAGALASTVQSVYAVLAAPSQRPAACPTPRKPAKY